MPWPVTEQTAEALRRLDAAERVAAASTLPEPELDVVAAAQVAQWDDELERLVAEATAARSDVVDVQLPSSLSATALAQVRDDPAAYAERLARPMPQPPSPSARFGTAFHAWVEARFGQQDLIDPDELPGRADADIDDYAELSALIETFEAGEFAERVPHRIEAGFTLVLARQVVRGRIDAVYAEPDGGFLVVDWKTNRQQSADPLQLAVYRLAWADLVGVPLERVRAGFYYVRHGELVVHDDLPDRAGLERLTRPSTPP